jgi:signal peptidase II
MLVNMCFSVIILLLDQFTKYLTIAFVKPVATVPVIQGAIHLTYAENKGAAFSILQNQRWFFIVATIIMLIAILIVWYRKKDIAPLCRVSLIMITGGAMGNFFDRLVRGYVVDMIDFRIINYAIFNIADCFVVVGTILLCIYILFFDKHYGEDKRNG